MEKTTQAPVRRADYDSPWKDLLDRWHQRFLEFFFPVIAADIDWLRGYEFLDKELQKVTRRAVVGRRHVDKLIKVWRRSGEETWVLIHTEVQGKRETDFARRLYTYHSRLTDRYDRSVATLAVLTDHHPDWRPERYEHALWGCRAILEFPTVKLLDYRCHADELQANDNPFAVVVLAQLAATATRRDPVARLQHKIGLTRRLYRHGLERDDILSLYAFIDWVLALPEALEEDYHRCIQEIEEAEHMQYVTTAERIGIRKGWQQGHQEGKQEGKQEGQQEGQQEGEARILLRLVTLKFGPPSDAVRQRIKTADAETLLTWSERILTAQCLDEVLR